MLGVAEHQLNDSNVDAVGVESARALVSQIVLAQVDALQLLAVPIPTFLIAPGFDAVGEQLNASPTRSESSGWCSPFTLPKTNALGSSATRRLRIAAKEEVEITRVASASPFGGKPWRLACEAGGKRRCSSGQSAKLNSQHRVGSSIVACGVRRNTSDPQVEMSGGHVGGVTRDG
jgi:hypothetical protein